MARIIFAGPGGELTELKARTGFSLMEIAVNAGIEGIDGECGGGCSCATCHIFVEQSYLGAIPEPTEYEADLLECLEARQPNSRLSCQIKVEDALDGVTVTIPAHQGLS